MKISDFFSAKQKENIPEGAIASLQLALDLNRQPEFQQTLALQIDAMLKSTGSCVLLSGENCPPLCREGIKIAEEIKEEDDMIFLSFAHQVFGKTPNPGDPVIFCLVSPSIAGIKFEWEWLWECWRRGQIELPRTDSDDMRAMDRHVCRQLQRLRDYRAKQERKRNGKRRQPNN